MTAVSALDDPRVADYRLVGDHHALAERGLFVVEGRLVLARLLALERMARDAAAPFPFSIHSVLVTSAALQGIQAALNEAAPVAPIYLVDQAVMNAVVGFNIHRGCLALATRPRRTALTDAMARAARRIVVLERVSNPDNVGGVFRSAAALGADLVVLGPDCGDPLYRKAVRTSMGAVLGLPFVDAGPWPDALRVLRNAGVPVVALTPRGDAVPIQAFTPDSPRVALLLGHEGEGLTAAALVEASSCVRIPMAAGVDSLNLASAASIAMFELFRPVA